MVLRCLKKFVHLTLIYCMIGVPTTPLGWAMDLESDENRTFSSRSGGEVPPTSGVQRRNLRIKDSKGPEVEYVKEETHAGVTWYLIDPKTKAKVLELLPLRDARVLGALSKYFDTMARNPEDRYTDGDELAFGGQVVDNKETHFWTNSELFLKATDMGILRKALRPFRRGRLALEVGFAVLFFGAAVGVTNVASGSFFNLLKIPLNGAGEGVGLLSVLIPTAIFFVIDGVRMGETVYNRVLHRRGKPRTCCGQSCGHKKTNFHKKYAFVTGESDDGHPWKYPTTKKEQAMRVMVVAGSIVRAGIPILLYLSQYTKAVDPVSVAIAIGMAPPLLHMYVSSALRNLKQQFRGVNWGHGENALKRRLMLGRCDILIEKLQRTNQKSVDFTRFLFELVKKQIHKRQREYDGFLQLERDFTGAIVSEFELSDEFKSSFVNSLPRSIRPSSEDVNSEGDVRNFINKALEKTSANGEFYLLRIQLLRRVLERILKQKGQDVTSHRLIKKVPEQFIPFFSLLMLKGATEDGKVKLDPNLHLRRERFVRKPAPTEKLENREESSPPKMLKSESENTPLLSRAEKRNELQEFAEHHVVVLKERNKELYGENASLVRKVIQMKRAWDHADQRGVSLWSRLSSRVARGLVHAGVLFGSFVYTWGARHVINGFWGEYWSPIAIEVASAVTGIAVSILASYDGEDVRRGIFRWKNILSKKADYWGLRKGVEIFSTFLATMLTFIEVAIGSEQLGKAINNPVLKYVILALGGAKTFFAIQHYIDMRIQNLVTKCVTRKPLSEVRTLRRERAYLIFLINELKKAIGIFDEETVENLYNHVERG